MPCETQRLPSQSLSERKVEVRAAIDQLSRLLASGKVRPVIGKQGAIAFAGWTDTERSRVSDVCAYRMLMVAGSALAKASIAKAEQIAGRTVDRRVIAQGTHSHDHGVSWHDHKG